MKKNTLLQYIFLVFMLGAQGCRCGEGNTKTPDHTPNNNQPSNTWDLSGNIYKANVKINEKDDWLTALGINKHGDDTVVVNASNESIKGGGGGLNGALYDWVDAQGVSPFHNPEPTLPDGTDAPNTLPAGKFALFKVSFGYIYLAVGPRAMQTESLKKTKELIANLYYDILSKANKDKMKCVVLCAISTAIFADAGKETDTGKDFTKAGFIANAFEGFKQGIAKFQQENPKHALKIILNKWDEEKFGKEVVDQVKPLTK
jgi:O-acetyl-ADP-ribose deacetylase (regulator of RNase III)